MQSSNHWLLGYSRNSLGTSTALKKTQAEMKVTLSEIKKNLQEINRGMDEVKNQINDLEHKGEKNIQSEQQEEKRIKKNFKDSIASGTTTNISIFSS